MPTLVRWERTRTSVDVPAHLVEKWCTDVFANETWVPKKIRAAQLDSSCCICQNLGASRLTGLPLATIRWPNIYKNGIGLCIQLGGLAPQLARWPNI
eukprot:1161831-Pelagomonas_calceolata.AAC.4